MDVILWKKELETNIDLIDAQHKEFIKRANKLVIILKARKPALDAAAEELEFLEQYLLYHFQAEEAMQFQSKYPQYKEHQAKHKNLAFRVKEIAIVLKAERFSDSAIGKFSDFIGEWIVNHILEDDVHFARYCTACKEQQKATVLPQAGD